MKNNDKDHALSLLTALPKNQWQTESPATEDEITSLERFFSIELPDDYREILLSANGGWLGQCTIALGLDDIDTLYDLNEDPYITKMMPDIFVFAGDGGGHLYFFDYLNKFTKGKNAVFWVPMGSMFRDDSVLLGRSITEVIKKILNNEDFNEYPVLGNDLEEQTKS